MNLITDQIAIGNYLDAEDTNLRASFGIHSMICLAGSNKRPDATGLDALESYDLKDGPGNNVDVFRRVVEKVARFSVRHPRLLVYCHAGRSRSVIVVAGYLMRANGWTASQALDFVASKREVSITSGIEKLLQSPFLFNINKI